MLSCDRFFDFLSEKGVTFFAGVPDSLLKSICAYITDHTSETQHVITANEGSAVAMATGYYLATGKVGLVYMQNSGLGNTVNPLTSLTDREVYGIPMLLMVGWRGEPGKKDEPQHIKMGRVTPGVFDALGLSYAVLPDDPEAAEAAVTKGVEHALAHREPYGLLVQKGCFDAYAPTEVAAAGYSMTREQATEAITRSLPAGALMVSTTGKPSRELYEIRERHGESHDGDFLTVGCMGHSSQIAFGVSLAKPDRPVYCLDGDGAVLMHMGGLAAIGTLGGRNFHHVILNNGAHDSVGGQPTVGFDVDLGAVARACGYRRSFVATTAEELAEHLDVFHQADGPVLLEVRVQKGARADLGRPAMQPEELKRRFMTAAGSVDSG
jgi:phosphonopyruvate decarboxylase